MDPATKWLIRRARDVYVAADELWDVLAGMAEDATAFDVDPWEGRRAVLIYNLQSDAGMDAGRAQISFDYVNYTDDAPDNTWTATDFETVEGLLDAWYNSFESRISERVSLEEIRWYRFGPDVEPPNAAVRVLPVTWAGTGTNAVLPPQVACTMTEITPMRRHWGRVYIPGTTAAQIVTNTGSWASAHVDAIADATETLYNAAAAADFLPVVYSPTHQVAFGVHKIQVDNIPDVMRSRRFQVPTIRDTRTLA